MQPIYFEYPQLSEAEFFEERDAEVLPAVILNVEDSPELVFDIEPSLSHRQPYLPRTSGSGTDALDHVQSIAFQILSRNLDPHGELAPGFDPLVSSVGRAALIASSVHQTQVDKLGFPYIEHPRRVFRLVDLNMDPEEFSAEERLAGLQAAWLHDVLEDSPDSFYRPITPEDLFRWGISPRAIEIAILLTRSDSSRSDYYARIALDPTARLVKLCDIADNTASWRAGLLPGSDSERLASKYANALAALRGEEDFQNLITLDLESAPNPTWRFFSSNAAAKVLRNYEASGRPLDPLLSKVEDPAHFLRVAEPLLWRVAENWGPSLMGGNSLEGAEGYQELVIFGLSQKLSRLRLGTDALRVAEYLSAELDGHVARSGGFPDEGDLVDAGVTSAELELHTARAVRNLREVRSRSDHAEPHGPQLWEVLTPENLNHFSDEELIEMVLAAFALDITDKYTYLKMLVSYFSERHHGPRL